ncbi:MAG TPA: hypothetical protein VKP12_13430, partial [Kiloniellaceae bacterium]|nr:hypothetical protein [Kiloniellaceae bacterium]
GLVNRARGLLATYENMAELIRIGAYKQGSDPAVDEAIRYYDALEAFLGQRKDEVSRLTEGYSELAGLLGLPDPAAAGAAPDAGEESPVAAPETAANRKFDERRERMVEALNLRRAKPAR